jgi:transcriptional regulator with XRE-family HTH domain
LKHLTQVELAEAVGVSVAILGGLERGTRQPSPEILEKLCRVLDVDEEELFGEGPDDSGS